jgi:hypothetical protein
MATIRANKAATNKWFLEFLEFLELNLKGTKEKIRRAVRIP